MPNGPGDVPAITKHQLITQGAHIYRLVISDLRAPLGGGEGPPCLMPHGVAAGGVAAVRHWAGAVCGMGSAVRRGRRAVWC